MTEKLSDFLQRYIKKKSIFKNKKALQSNYTPKNVPYRGEQINQLAGILAPSLRMEKPSNVFIYGKTGCIAGDSLVYTSNGLKKIKEVDINNDKVLSYNIKKRKYEWSDFIFLRFTNKDKLLKLILDNGYEITVTKDHPLLLSNMKWQKANKLNLGDEVVIAYNLPNITTKEVPLALARLLGFIIGDGSLNKRKRKVKDSRGYIYNSDRQRFRFFNEEPELLYLVKSDLFYLFNCTPSIIYPKDRCTHVNTISQEVCGLLNQVGVPFGKKSDIVEVPQIILESTNLVQREFLKALFSCDGTVSQNTYIIEYYSNSKKLLQQIMYLLHQEGISCKIRPKQAKLNGKLFSSYRLYISNQDNLIKFYYKIGFYSKNKQYKLEKMLVKYNKRKDFYYKNYMLSKIVNIKDMHEEFVYDLTVPKNHNFIANGVISHNTGKTLIAKHVTNNILKIAHENKINLKFVYLNCKLKKVADTEYRLIAQIAREFGEEIPATGLPTDEIYKIFLKSLDKNKQILIIILDEIDQLVSKVGDEILYNLTRLNSELKESEISFIGISNDLIFIDNVDPRVKSSLGEEEIVFPPYNAIQLQKILRQRAGLAFFDNIMSDGVIEKCAAYAAREHGDARRALELLRVAAELVERKNEDKILVDHIDKAEDKIERDRVFDIIITQPKQFKLTLYSILSMCNGNSKGIFTGDIYNVYKDNCNKCGIKPLTQRRLSDIVAELDMLGIINAKVISKGRYGRTRAISLAIPESTIININNILKEGLGL